MFPRWLIPAPLKATKPECVLLPSPYTKKRTQDVSILVVHAMGEWIIDDDKKFHHATDWLDILKLSVHAFILPDGRLIQSAHPQMFLCHHAKGINAIAAGCEFLIAGPQSYGSLLERMEDTENPPYTEAQYRTGGWWYAHAAAEAGLDWAAVMGHQTIDPARKRDPGAAFDWDRLRFWFDRAAIN